MAATRRTMEGRLENLERELARRSANMEREFERLREEDRIRNEEAKRTRDELRELIRNWNESPSRGGSRTIRRCRNSKSKGTSQTAFQRSQTSSSSQSSSRLDSLSSRVSSQARTVSSSSPSLLGSHQSSSQEASTSPRMVSQSEVTSSQPLASSYTASQSAQISPESKTEFKPDVQPLSEQSEVDILPHQESNHPEHTDAALGRINKDKGEDKEGWSYKIHEQGLGVMMDFVYRQSSHITLKWLNRFVSFRIDDFTSMMYTQKGLGEGFKGNFKEYGGYVTEIEAALNLLFVNDLNYGLLKDVIIVGEDVKGLPAVCISAQEGTVGVHYSLRIDITGKGIIILRKRGKDGEKGVSVHTITNRRWMEKYISEADSQDQAIVVEGVVLFWGALARQLGKNDLQRSAIEGSVFIHSNVKSGMAFKGFSSILSAIWDSSNAELRWVDEFILNSIVERKVQKMKEIDAVFTWADDTNYLIIELPLLKIKLESFAKSLPVDGGWNQKTTLTTQAWLSGENKQNIGKALSSCESVTRLRNKIDRQVLKSLGAKILKRHESLLLHSSDSWPHWLLPNLNIRERMACSNQELSSFDVKSSEGHMFVSIYVKLLSKFGGGACLLACARLAGEVLCTGSGPGGNVLSSFLPSLVANVKSSELNSFLPSLVANVKSSELNSLFRLKNPRQLHFYENICWTAGKSEQENNHYVLQGDNILLYEENLVKPGWGQLCSEGMIKGSSNIKDEEVWLRVDKQARTYWEGRGAKMKLKGMAVSYSPP